MKLASHEGDGVGVALKGRVGGYAIVINVDFIPENVWACLSSLFKIAVWMEFQNSYGE